MNATIVVHDNALREDIVRAWFSSYGELQKTLDPSPTISWKERGALLVQGSLFLNATGDAQRGRQRNVRPDTCWLKYIHKSVREEKTNHYAAEIGFIIGEKYVFVDNINQTIGMVKNMMCYLVDIILRPAALPVWDPDLGTHIVDALDVHYLLVQYDVDSLKDKVLFTGFPVGMAPVFTQDRVFTIVLNQGTFKRRMTISQFPLVSAKVCTGHKVQGQTLPNVIVAQMPARDFEWLRLKR